MCPRWLGLRIDNAGGFCERRKHFVRIFAVNDDAVHRIASERNVVRVRIARRSASHRLVGIRVIYYFERRHQSLPSMQHQLFVALVPGNAVVARDLDYNSQNRADNRHNRGQPARAFLILVHTEVTIPQTAMRGNYNLSARLHPTAPTLNKRKSPVVPRSDFGKGLASSFINWLTASSCAP